MIVMKFGGVALKTGESVRNISKIIKTYIKRDPIIVLSAMGNSTDMLLKMGMNASQGVIDIGDFLKFHEKICDDLNVEPSILISLIKELNEVLFRIKEDGALTSADTDELLSFGERLSVRIVSAYLNKSGIKSRAYDSWEVGMITDSTYGKAKILDETYANLRRFFSDKTVLSEIPIITGFIARDFQGKITTFGRGGSDLTASIIGAALDCEEIQTWKNVDGVLSADPSIVENVKLVRHISYREAHELAFFGAKILHPHSLIPSKEKNIPIHVKNFSFPDAPGTIISNKTDENEIGLKSLTCRKDVTLVNIESPEMIGEYGFLARIFTIFKALKISVDLIATSEASISLTLDNTVNLEKLVKCLSSFSDVRIKKKMAIVSLIGRNYNSPTILGKIFYVFHKEGVNIEMISQGASKVNTAFVIDEEHADKAIKEIHRCLFENKLPLGVIE